MAKKTFFKSAKTGKFVTESYAKTHKATTYKSSTKPSNKPKRK